MLLLIHPAISNTRRRDPLVQKEKIQINVEFRALNG